MSFSTLSTVLTTLNPTPPVGPLSLLAHAKTSSGAIFAYVARGMVLISKGDHVVRLALQGCPPKMRAMTVSPDGTRLLLCGERHVAVVLLPSRLGALLRNGTSASLTAHAFPLRHCAGDDARVLDAAWHPLGVSHVVVLASDARIRLYDASAALRSERPERVVLVPADTVAFALGHDGGSTEAWREAWGAFACFILSDAGHVSVVCPLVPRGCLLPRRMLDDLEEGLVHGNVVDDQTRAWLRNSVGRVVARSTPHGGDGEWVRFEPYDAEPLLVQGPLAVSDAVSSSACALLSLSGGAPAVLIVAHTDGTLNALVGIESVEPRWAGASSKDESDEQCAGRLHMYERIDLAVAGDATCVLQRVDASFDALLVQHADGVHVVRTRWLDALRQWCRDALLSGGKSAPLPQTGGSMVRAVLLGGAVPGAVALRSAAAGGDVLVSMAPGGGLDETRLVLDDSVAVVTTNDEQESDSEGDLTTAMDRMALEYDQPFDAFAVQPLGPFPRFVVPPSPTDYAEPSTLNFVTSQASALRRRMADMERLQSDLDARRELLRAVSLEQELEVGEIEEQQQRAAAAADALDVKLRRVQRTHELLVARTDGVLTLLNSCQSGLSDAEIEWHAELRNKTRRVGELKRAVFNAHQIALDLERKGQLDKPDQHNVGEHRTERIGAILAEQMRAIESAVRKIQRLQTELNAAT